MPRLIMDNEVVLPVVAKMLAEGVEVTLPVKGNSMLPFIVGGQDSVTLLKPSGPLEKWEIVFALTDAGGYVLHRIIACNEEQIILMGDGNLHGKEICSRENVFGVVKHIIKGKRYIDCECFVQIQKARLWHLLIPVRRYLLAVYRRTILKEYENNRRVQVTPHG